MDGVHIPEQDWCPVQGTVELVQAGYHQPEIIMLQLFMLQWTYKWILTNYN